MVRTDGSSRRIAGSQCRRLPVGDKALEELARAEAEPVLQSLGFELVELSVGLAHKNTHVTVVVFRRDGVGVDDLALLNRTVRPGLESALATEEMTVTVSSPGIDRKIKDRREYVIFKGRGAKLRVRDNEAWIGGVIEDCDGNMLRLATPDGRMKIDLDTVTKAKLDSSQEVVNLNHVF